MTRGPSWGAGSRLDGGSALAYLLALPGGNHIRQQLPRSILEYYLPSLAPRAA